MMHLSEISIRRPVFAWMLMAALIIFGVICFKRLGVSRLPDVDFPVIRVSLSLPGAAPEVMETQVIDPLEDAIMQIGGIKNITSSSQQNSGSISVEFELDREIDEAMQEVQGRISQVRNLLPVGLQPPTLRKSNPEDQPILWIALTSDGTAPTIDTMIYARNELYNQFGTVSGVGDIILGGYVDPALRIRLDADKLKKQSLTADDIIQAIQKEHVELPVGRIVNKGSEYNIRLMGEALTPREFGKILINNRLGQGVNYRPQHLNQVGTVEEGTVDIRRIARYNGQPTVGLGILKQHGSNAVEVAQRVREKLEEILPTIPKNYKASIRSDNTRFIKQSVDELNFTLLLSALCTSVVCFLFLGSWTSTLNILMAIPTSIIGTFIGIYFLGFTLNTFTLLGLSLAIGIVVDDAIMMLENIVRHRQLGEKRKTAALKGAKEISFAALAATIAVVAVFLPVIFMKGVIGKYFFQYGITVSIAVLLSLLEALTLTPMRCAKYLKINDHTSVFASRIEAFFKKLSDWYRSFLKVLLSHRWKTLLIATTLFLSSFIVAKKLPTEMMPAQDQSQVLLRLKGPVGTTLSSTDSQVKIAEEYLRKIPEVSGVFSMIGGFGGDAVSQGSLFVSLVDPDERKISQGELIKKFKKDLKVKITGMQLIVQDLSLRGFAASRGFPIEFIIQGPDWNKLTDLTSKIMEEFKKSGLMTDINTDTQPGMTEIRMIPNREKLAKHGVSLNSVTSAVSAMVGGVILNGQTEYSKAGHRYQIEIRLLASQRNKASQLNHIQLRNNRGEFIPLSELVDLKEEKSLMTISRLNRLRSITVYGNPAPGHSQKEVLQSLEKLGQSTLPSGYVLKPSGSSQSFDESFKSLFFAMGLGILVSYMVLASQFNSFIHPVTVLVALPFSFSGAFIALTLGHQSINIYSLIGFILLMGIAKKNSILLVDFTNQCRSEGADVHAALLKACPVRLRPILMTSLATIAGAFPAALAVGPGAETTIPMAIAIIGGVTASTILTLLVIPCVYSLVARLERPDSLAPF